MVSAYFSVAYFQRGAPIYSSHYVRFRLGHESNNSQHIEKSENGKGESGKSPVQSNYVWTYTSQEFSMAQVCYKSLSSFFYHNVTLVPELLITNDGFFFYE